MAKRYHQSKKDRMDESRGQERSDYRRTKMQAVEHFAGADPRRRQEMEDAGMISEDHNAIANLPQGVIMKYYRNAGSYMPEGLDDTLEGIDRQMSYDNSKRMQHLLPKKV